MTLFDSMLQSFFTTAHAEEDKPEEAEAEESSDQDEEPKEEDEADDGEDDAEEEDEDEDEDEEEPEDPKPALEDECANSRQCAPAKHHFDDCVERVTEAGEHPEHKEDCVEEFFHLAHCATTCAAPKLWSKLK